ncbi:hypothetical protein FB567DRAFT_445167 [Paraphoma chrysanthemicola]|uniref:YDG domain-containing protein n=1 Tax=Paraphoma chrysanthemicola TaxID=798071 RepID=A0A8K0R679_9PLEO|nr:hypothetical protein FB567DRAFT_445167 [Paraphoma chrysanthemicola]
MAVPEESGRREVKPFTPPSWMLKRAQDNAARLGYAPDALAKKLQEMRETSKVTHKKVEDHATMIRTDPNAMANKLAETREQYVPVVLATQPRMDEDNSRPTMQEQVAPRIPTGRATQPPQTMEQSAREMRDDRRAKKARVRSKQVLKEGESSASVPAEITMPTIAESSRTGAAREGAIKAADAMDKAMEEAMDIDPSPSLFVSQTERYPTATVLPKWYINITEKNFEMKKIVKNRPQALTSLEALKNCIGRAEIEIEHSRSNLDKLFEELRDHVHKAEIKLQVDRYLVKKARMLNPENGLPRIFNDAKFPSDLRADSYQLYKRWLKEGFDQDILRGIVTVKGKDRNGDRIDTAYRSKHPASAKYYGQGDLVLGQWWPTQLCTVRDGAHGSTQGGISGEKDKGAYSIVLSGSSYDDKDDGDVIEYSGTDGKNFTPTDVTQHMITSATLGNVIRVIRSSQLQKGKSKYRPELGLRYDGLYKIKSYQLVEKEKQRYQFRLERCEGQDPIRSEDNAARRPTIYEVEEFERLRSKVW